jgi:hypothetical protein
LQHHQLLNQGSKVPAHLKVRVSARNTKICCEKVRSWGKGGHLTLFQSNTTYTRILSMHVHTFIPPSSCGLREVSASLPACAKSIWRHHDTPPPRTQPCGWVSSSCSRSPQCVHTLTLSPYFGPAHSRTFQHLTLRTLPAISPSGGVSITSWSIQGATQLVCAGLP